MFRSSLPFQGRVDGSRRQHSPRCCIPLLPMRQALCARYYVYYYHVNLGRASCKMILQALDRRCYDLSWSIPPTFLPSGKALTSQASPQCSIMSELRLRVPG